MRIYMTIIALALLVLQGCAGVSTFPKIARAGDTVTVMVGGSEKVRKGTISVELTDAEGGVYDIAALGLIRSVFTLRTDARAKGMHYSSYIESYNSWNQGHEPVQTVLVFDIPPTAAVGDATILVSHNANDDASGFSPPYSVKIEVLAGIGKKYNFPRKDISAGVAPVEFVRLEPAPHGKISFGINDGVVIGAASLVVDFNEAIVNPDDINIYVPESNVRGSVGVTGAFGETQRMVHWRHDGSQMYIDIIAPQGIDQKYLKVYLMHPDGLSGGVSFNIISSKFYDVNGSEFSLEPSLEYYSM